MRAVSFMICLIFLSALSGNIFAQKAKVNYYHFVFSDSSKVTGSVVFEDENIVQIKNLSGSEIRINKRNILIRKEVVVDITSVVKNTSIVVESKELMSHNSNEAADSLKAKYIKDKTQNRLFLAPTARNLKGGSGNAGVHEVFIPYLSIGIIDRVSVSASFFIYPHLLGILFLSTQVNIYSGNNKDVAFGVLISTNFNSREWSSPFFYGVTSLGNSNSFANLGVGVSDYNGMLVLIGGEFRISDRGKIITDNIILSTGVGILSLGVRVFGENISFDFGMITGIGLESNKFLLPWIGMAYNF